jgi:drug/metabolite transporter (DMT)-like permease
MNNSLISLVLGTFCIGLAPMMVRFCDLAPSLIGLYRTSIAAAVLLFWHILGKKEFPKKRRFYGITLLGGLFFALDLMVWHRSVHLLGPGMSTILGNTQVFYLLILGFFLYGEKVTLGKLGIFTGAFLGVVLILKGQFKFYEGENYFFGCLFGLATGFFYSLFTSTLKKTHSVFPPPSSLSVVTFISLFTAFWLLLFSFFESGYKTSFVDNWIPLVGLALIGQVAGWGLISRGIKGVPLSLSGLVILLQPVIAKLTGVFIFEEPFSLLEVLGIALLLLFIFIGSRKS